ncbi:MAG: WcbI family polysaccharide biosynthesis putative acetyltransferase [Methylocystis sp.]
MLSQIDKQILRAHLLPSINKVLGRAPLRGPRLAVFGNCQSYGIAYAMKVLVPSAQVDHYSAINKTFANIEWLAKTLEGYDRVFMQNFPAGIVRGGDYRDILPRLTKVTRMPSMVFAAFQPDLVYLFDETRGSKPLHGPLRAYHSALAAFAFRVGLSLREANALFNDNVFATVGYYDIWDASARELIEEAKSYFGFDFSSDLMNWSRRGVFMYSIVHPKPFVLATVARRMLEATRIPIENENFEEYAIDDLARSEIWPVYPEIAARFGVRGGYLFKHGNFHISHGVGEFFNLPQFLKASYAVYKRARPQQIANPRVDGWLSDRALSSRLVELAKENLAAGATPVM